MSFHYLKRAVSLLMLNSVCHRSFMTSQYGSHLSALPLDIVSHLQASPYVYIACVWLPHTTRYSAYPLGLHSEQPARLPPSLCGCRPLHSVNTLCLSSSEQLLIKLYTQSRPSGPTARRPLRSSTHRTKLRVLSFNP